ncbi:MAG: hypothetical protein KGY76_00485 [Candidatus Thermoplasmatota archaeon]|nr:hypothetical protein [Candidatus Thermoplasmatota archaeon]
MKEKDEDDRGILIRIISNKDIQKGFGLFAIALILAFTSVTTTIETDVKDEEVGPEEESFERIHYPRYTVRNATLELDFEPDGDSTTHSEAEIKVLNASYDDIWETTWNQNFSRTIDMTDLDGTPYYLSFNVTNGTLTYSYSVTYPNKPYSILSLPAIVFTLVGMVYAFKGRGVILGEIKMKRMEEERKKQMEKRKEEKEETSEEEDEDEESRKVIYEGDKDETGSKKGGADHINFMGLPDESEGENGEDDN